VSSARQSNLLQLRHDCDANDRGISSRDKAKSFCQKNVNWRAFWWKLQQFSLLLRSAHHTACRPTEATSNARKTPQLRCCGCQPCVCVIFEKCLAFPSNRNVRQAVYLLGSVCSGFHVCFLFVAQALGAIPGYYANDMLPGRGKSPIFKSAGLSGDCSDGDCRNKEWSCFLVLTPDLWLMRWKKRSFRTGEYCKNSACCASWQANWKTMPLSESHHPFALPFPSPFLSLAVDTLLAGIGNLIISAARRQRLALKPSPPTAAKAQGSGK